MPLRSETSLDRLHRLLRSGCALTLAGIVDRLDITSKRHVRRLLRQLRASGVPVRERRCGREKEFYLPDEELHVEDEAIALTERQALALVVAAEAARAVLGPTPLARPLDEAFETLTERLAAAAHTYDLDRIREHWHFERTPVAQGIDPEVFDVLVRALNERRSVRIDYHTASTGTFSKDRKIDPLVMAAPGGSWRVVAYCHERKKPLDFTLARIERIRPCDRDTETADFTPPTDFDPELHFLPRFGALGGEDDAVIRLLVEPEYARYFREKKYHETQCIDDERDDGRIVVSFDAAGLDAVAAWVLSWGAGVKVLDPLELADRIAANAAAVQERYAS